MPSKILIIALLPHVINSLISVLDSLRHTLTPTPNNKCLNK